MGNEHLPCESLKPGSLLRALNYDMLQHPTSKDQSLITCNGYQTLLMPSRTSEPYTPVAMSMALSHANHTPSSPLKPAELQVLRAQYEKEGEYVSLQTKFNYAWVC